MKTLGTAVTVGAAGIGILQWWQIVYRLHLFFGEYRGERAVNHIGDGDFALIYILNAMLLASVIFALGVLWQSRSWRISAIGVGVVNALGCLSLFIMHQTGALVEYSEFIRHMKGQG